MIFPKSEFRDFLNPLFWVWEESPYLQKQLFGPIDNQAKFKSFKSNFSWSNKYFKKTLFGALPNIYDWI